MSISRIFEPRVALRSLRLYSTECTSTKISARRLADPFTSWRRFGPKDVISRGRFSFEGQLALSLK